MIRYPGDNLKRGKMDKGGIDPKVLAQAAKHFEKFFTSEVRSGRLKKRITSY